ncbi:MAG TPA: post-COAP-1 domain-containing protein [Anaeromyxobacter sp.]
MQTVRWLAGASLLALAGMVGCGGSEDVASTTQAWENQPPPEEENKCECKVTGGGVEFVTIGHETFRFTFGFNEIPTSLDDAKGHITLQVHGVDMEFCRVDTVESCDPVAEVVVFSGELRGGGRCTVTVDDNGEPGRDDTIDFVGGGFDFGATLIKGGNVQFHKPKPKDCQAQDNKN